MWTHFMDMHSGGGTKEPPYEYIYIEAPEEEACIIFYNRFGHNPYRVSCTCCGGDYSIDEGESLAEATAHNRGCHWDEQKRKYIEEQNRDYSINKYCTLEEYCQRDNILIIFDEEIEDHEREGELPEQGYVWID